jgi:hypothetical protein
MFGGKLMEYSHNRQKTGHMNVLAWKFDRGLFLLERVTADPMDRVSVTDHQSFDAHIDRGVLETFFRTSNINWRRQPRPVGSGWQMTDD